MLSEVNPVNPAIHPCLEVTFMIRQLALAALVLALAVPAPAADLSLRGHYVEARNCDVWTGPCFANADFNLTGKHAVIAWRIDQGQLAGVDLEGLSVAAVIAAHNTLGLDQTGPAKAVLIVDRRANASQREALVQLAKRQGGKLLANVVAVQSADVNLIACACKADACYELVAGGARIKTRCLDSNHDKACGNETAYYPPLTRGVTAQPAGVVEHVFRGTGLAETWSDYERRGAYVGTFEVR
jgi:hypothetical protein